MRRSFVDRIRDDIYQPEPIGRAAVVQIIDAGDIDQKIEAAVVLQELQRVENLVRRNDSAHLRHEIHCSMTPENLLRQRRRFGFMDRFDESMSHEIQSNRLISLR